MGSLYLIRHVVLKATQPEKNYNELITAAYYFLIILIWGLLKWILPRAAPLLVFVVALSECIFVNLFIRDQVPRFMTTDDMLMIDDKILATMVCVYCYNYNSFLSTTLILPPMFLISYYFQLLKQVDLWWHPYLHRPFNDD